MPEVTDKENQWSRPSRDEYFMKLAHLVSEKSTCLRRRVGAVAVKENRIISTGFNGSPKGLAHCAVVGCLRDQQNIPSGQRHELCRAVHAEQNVIIQAAFFGVPIKGSILYTTDSPCVLCTKMCINAGITEIIYDNEYLDELSMSLLEESGIRFRKYTKSSSLTDFAQDQQK